MIGKLGTAVSFFHMEDVWAGLKYERALVLVKYVFTMVGL